MIKKVVKVKCLSDYDSKAEDLKFWLDKSPGERVAAVDYLRRLYNGNTGRLQRVARVIQRTQS